MIWPFQKNNVIKNIIYFIGLVFICACASKPAVSGLDTYYFPLDELDSAQVYTYSSLLDERHPSERWIYKSLDSGQRLRSYNLDSNNRVSLSQQEIVVSNGTLLDDLDIITYDSLGVKSVSNANIEGANMFSFEWMDTSNIVFYKISYQEVNDSLSNTGVIINRSFGGYTTFKFNEEDYPAIRILSQKIISTNKNGSIELAVQSEEIYAEGLGRVAFKSKINGETAIEYTLYSIQKLSNYELENGPVIGVNN